MTRNEIANLMEWSTPHGASNLLDRIERVVRIAEKRSYSDALDDALREGMQWVIERKVRGEE